MLLSRAEADSVTINKPGPGFRTTDTISSFILKQWQSGASEITWLGCFEMRRKARGESRQAGRDPAPAAGWLHWQFWRWTGKGRTAASARSLLQQRRLSVKSACGDAKTSKTTASVPQTICTSSHIYFILVQHRQCVWTCFPWTEPFRDTAGTTGGGQGSRSAATPVVRPGRRPAGGADGV